MRKKTSQEMKRQNERQKKREENNPEKYKVGRRRRLHHSRPYLDIAEKKLGRKLKEGETVHHIDMNSSNNRVENIYIYDNQSEHAKGHGSLNQLVPILLERSIVKFKDGRYYACQE